MVCAGDDVRCVALESGAGAVAGGVAVAADEPSDVGSNRAVAAFAGDSVVFLECSLLVKRDSDMPVTVSVMLR